MASEDLSCAAWLMMLRHGSILDCLGASKHVSQLLFTAMCSPSTAPEDAQSAFEELSKCLKLQCQGSILQSSPNPSHSTIIYKKLLKTHRDVQVGSRRCWISIRPWRPSDTAAALALRLLLQQTSSSSRLALDQPPAQA